MLDLLSQNNVLTDVLASSDEALTVIYGDGTGYEELKPVNLVLARYYTSENNYGYIGVIGPARMDYEKVIPSIRYFASRFGDTMLQAIKDLNDWEG